MHLVVYCVIDTQIKAMSVIDSIEIIPFHIAIYAIINKSIDYTIRNID